MRMESLYDHAEAIYRAGLARVDPVSMMRRVLTLYGDELRLATESRCLDLDLSVFDNVRVLGAGKASARMALGLERLLGERIAGGVVVVKDGCKEPLSRIRLMEASHPIPDERSAAAA
jgi:glycerate 2-kinase